MVVEVRDLSRAVAEEDRIKGAGATGIDEEEEEEDDDDDDEDEEEEEEERTVVA